MAAINQMTTSWPIQVVLLDIEGTVCPISFVKDVLFPYALRVLPDTIKSQWDDPEFKPYRDQFPQEYSSNLDAFQSHVIDLVTKDVKVSYLKSLQGFLWEKGYQKGDLKAPLFRDVSWMLARWHGKKLKIMIYSSGSVPAQKLLFKHTDAEPSDLTMLISDWFDTVNAGPKTETKSYKTIQSKHPKFLASQWLFLSDNVQEVDAAIAAGMQSVVVQRPGNAVLPTEVTKRLQVIHSFDDFDTNFKIAKSQLLGMRERETVSGTGGDTNLEASEAAEAEDSHKAKKTRLDEESKPTSEDESRAQPEETA